MSFTIDRPPKTIMEVYRMLPEGTRAELIEGTLYMSPAPLLNHQDVIADLLIEIRTFVKQHKLGKVFPSPIDVYLNQKNALQPDIVFVSKANSSILKEDGVYGAPDIVIEVLSPGTSRTDLTTKKSIYEKEKVKEYWVVDPKTKLATGFLLNKNKYEVFKKEKGKLNSPLLKHIFKF